VCRQVADPLVVSIQDHDASGAEWTCQRLQDVVDFARGAYYAARLWQIITA
jgi:hypothetical protein